MKSLLTTLAILLSITSCETIPETSPYQGETERIILTELAKQPEANRFFKDVAAEFDLMLQFDSITIQDLKDMALSMVESSEGLDKASLSLTIQEIFSQFPDLSQSVKQNREKLELVLLQIESAVKFWLCPTTVLIFDRTMVNESK